MLRPEKELTDPAAIEEIIRRAQVCHLAMCKDNQPLSGLEPAGGLLYLRVSVSICG